MSKKGETGEQDRGKPQPQKKKDRETKRKDKKSARLERQKSRQDSYRHQKTPSPVKTYPNPELDVWSSTFFSPLSKLVSTYELNFFSGIIHF